MRDDLSGDYVLANDLGPLDAGYDTYASASANGGLGWEPIGTTSARFTGEFDGNGFEITGLVVDRTPSNNIGFFGAVGGGATLSNIRLIDASISGNVAVGGLVGSMAAATITNSHVSGLVNGGTASSGYDIGGLVGSTEPSGTTVSLVLSSSSSATVSGHGGVGGIVGRFNPGGLIEECYYSGTLAARSTGSGVGMIAGFLQGHVDRSYAGGTAPNVTSRFIGGFAGDIEDHGTIVDSYTVSNISGADNVGGFAGRIMDPESLSRTFSTGTVTFSSSPGGGMIGYTFAAPATSSYWNSEVNDPTLQGVGSGSSAGVTGLTTAEMKYPHSGGAYDGWDFDTVWADGSTMYNDGYPYLQWQTQTYSVEYTAGVGGSLDTSAEPASRLRIPGATSSITAIPNTGYVFTQWSDGNTDATRTDVAINGDIAVTAQFLDVVPPTTSASAESIQVGGAITGTYSATDNESGLDSFTLYIREPGANWAISGPVTGSTWSHTPSQVGDDADGLYRFAIVAIDNDGNSSPVPTGDDPGQGSVLYNDLANSNFAQTFTTDGTLLFPMTATQVVEIELTGVTDPVTVTVNRTTGDVAPAGFMSERLVNESLNITGDLDGAIATITWNLDSASLEAPGFTSTLDTVFRFDGAAQTEQFNVTPSGNTLVISPVDAFSDWYAGSNDATVHDWLIMNQ